MKRIVEQQGSMNVELEVARQKGLFFFRSIGTSQLITILNSGVLAYLYGGWPPNRFALIWWLMAISLATLRYMTAQRFLQRAYDIHQREIQGWQQWACVGALLAGSLWAMGCAVFMNVDHQLRIFVVMVSAGMIAGAMTSLTAILSAFFCFELPVLTAIIGTALFRWHDETDSLLILVSLLFGGVVSQSARRYYRNLDQSVRLAFELKNNQVQLQQAANVFLHATEGIVITDITGRILNVNQAFSHITGYQPEQILGRRAAAILYSGKQGKTKLKTMVTSLDMTGEWSGEVWGRRKNSAPFAAMLNVSAVHNDAGKILHYVSLFSDITAMKEHELELKRIAHYDMLTGLPNRALLTDRLNQALADSQRRHSSLAIVYLDLDGFKDINDRWGHAVGDQLLVAISQRMHQVLRQGDTLARLGGDEFVAILGDMKKNEHAESVLNRLLSSAAEPINLDGKLLQISASIGVTVYPEDCSDADQLLRHADQAMYQAKQQGKNQIQMFTAD